MIVLLPILWLALWAVISLLSCAALGLGPAAALHTGTVIFLSGGVGLPVLGFTAWRISRYLKRQR